MKRCFTVALALTWAGEAQAGPITLVSDVWDYLPEVEIVSGNNAPQAGAHLGPMAVNKGWSATFQDRVCYRRSANPSVTGSGWTDWSCISHPNSDSESDSLN